MSLVPHHCRFALYLLTATVAWGQNASAQMISSSISDPSPGTYRTSAQTDADSGVAEDRFFEMDMLNSSSLTMALAGNTPVRFASLNSVLPDEPPEPQFALQPVGLLTAKASHSSMQRVISDKGGLVESGFMHSAVCVPGGRSGCGCGACRMEANTRLGRFAQGLYASVCCPDPCYTPTWTMLANAAFFSDAPRPQSRQRFRWDFNGNFVQPDRAEYLWARSGERGPATERSIDYHELTMISEIATDKAGLFVKTPYRSTYLDNGGHFAGFADISTGTKTLLHDTQLLQIAAQFETHIPTASPGKGLSNGHLSLEPALMAGLQLSDSSFLQMQLSQWIPIGGNQSHAGALLKHSMSYNHLLAGAASGTSLVGTLEYSALHFQDGEFTDPFGNRHRASNEAVMQLGGGLRLNLCNQVNFGFGGMYSADDWPTTALRTEFQWLH